MKIDVREGYPELEVEIRCPAPSGEVQKIVAALQSFDRKLSGVKDGQTYLIDRHDVLYFESVDKRTFAYTADDVFETPLCLYELEDQFTAAGFFRSAKSQVINIAKISSLCPDFGGRIEVKLANGERLIVSRQYAKALKERLGLK